MSNLSKFLHQLYDYLMSSHNPSSLIILIQISKRSTLIVDNSDRFHPLKEIPPTEEIALIFIPIKRIPLLEGINRIPNGNATSTRNFS